VLFARQRISGLCVHEHQLDFLDVAGRTSKASGHMAL
jgi:hypothetical protein